MNEFIKKVLVLSLSFLLFFVAIDRGPVFANEQTPPTVATDKAQDVGNDLEISESEELEETNMETLSALSSPVDNLINRASGINVTARCLRHFKPTRIQSLVYLHLN